MFLSYLSVAFLLGTAIKGTITENVTTSGGMNNETSTTPTTSPMTYTTTSPSSTTKNVTVSVPTTTTKNVTTESTASPPSTTNPPTTSGATTTTENATTRFTTMKPPTTHPEMTFSPPSTESRTTIEAVNTAVTQDSNVTTNRPTDSPSTPTAGSTPSATSPKTSQSTSTSETTNTTTTAAPDPTLTTTNVTTTSTPTTQADNVTTTSTPTTQPNVTTTSTPTTTNVTTTVTTTTVVTTTSTPPTVPPSGNTTASTTTTTLASNTTTTPASTTTTTPVSTTTAATTNTVTTQRPTETTTNSTTAPPIPPPIVCPAVPCPPDSSCFHGTCQCFSGSFLQDGRCVPAQVFPGQLHIVSLEFNEEMRDRSSPVFQRTAADITAALREALRNEPGYRRSDVVQLEPGSVQATVNNIFENTNATQESVDQSIKNAINNSNTNGLLAHATFAATNLCLQEPVPCDVDTTTCTNTDGRAVCFCKKGYVSLLYSNTSCRACASGQQAVGDTHCEPCSFGYSGFNCNDSSLLAVVVISCVLGAILLIIVLALLIFCCWKGCSQSKPDSSSSPYSSGDANEPWPTGITPIPRATTKFDAATPIEMTEGGSTNNLVDRNNHTNGLSGSYDLNPDGMRTFKGKNPSRYSYLVQGHENPYFLPGDGSKN